MPFIIVVLAAILTIGSARDAGDGISLIFLDHFWDCQLSGVSPESKIQDILFIRLWGVYYYAVTSYEQ